MVWKLRRGRRGSFIEDSGFKEFCGNLKGELCSSLLCLICGVKISCVSCFGMCLGSLEGNEWISDWLGSFVSIC